MIVPWCVGIISWENLLPNFDPVPLQSIWFREIDPLDKPAFCLGSCQLDISTYFSFYHFTAPQPGQTFWRFRNCKFEILLFLVLHKCQRFCGFLNCLVGPCFQSINRWSPAQKAISEKSPTLHSIAINNLAALAIPQKTGKKEWKAREQKKRKKKLFHICNKSLLFPGGCQKFPTFDLQTPESLRKVKLQFSNWTRPDRPFDNFRAFKSFYRRFRTT